MSKYLDGLEALTAVDGQIQRTGFSDWHRDYQFRRDARAVAEALRLERQYRRELKWAETKRAAKIVFWVAVSGAMVWAFTTAILGAH